MAKFSTDTKTDILVHIGILLSAFLVIFFAFFFFFLPWITNHDEAIEVPDMRGMSISEMEDILDIKDLNYEISDSTFIAGKTPLSVFSHYPKAGAKVKSDRKIYVTIITDKAPMVAMPDVVGRSSNSAKNLLVSLGFTSPDIEFTPAMEKNTVLKLKFNGEEINVGKKIAKGSKITLVVGDGFGNTTVDVPDVVGMPLDEADVLITGMGLNLGSVLYDESSNQAPGIVTRQRPSDGQLKTGSTVNVWVSGNNQTEGIPSVDN